MTFRRPMSTLAFLAFSVLSPGAFADVPPGDACNPTDVGKACSNAGPNFDQPGICTTQKCTKYNPSDGGIYEYDCTLCTLGGDAGTSSSAAGASSSGTGAGSSSSGASSGGDSGSGKDPGQDSGCAVTAGHREGAVAALLLAVGLGAFGWARRRERRG